MANVIAAPGEVFDEVRTSPPSAANWLAPTLTLLLVSWIGAWAIFSQDSIKAQLKDITAKALEKQVEKGKISQQQAEKAQPTAEKMAVTFGIVGAVTIPLFVAFGTAFVGGLVVWLAGNKALNGSFSYMKGVEVAGLACTIGILGEALRILLVLVLGNIYAAPSLALLVRDVDPQSPTFMILSLFNLMLFWELGVRSLGLARLTGASFGKAAIWVFGIWAAISGLFVGFGLGMRAAFGG